MRPESMIKLMLLLSMLGVGSLYAQFCKRDFIEEACHYPIKNKEQIYERIDSFMTMISRGDTSLYQHILPSDYEIWGDPFSEIAPYSIGYDQVTVTIVGMIDIEPNLLLIKLKFDYTPDSIQAALMGIYNIILHCDTEKNSYKFEDYRSYSLRNNFEKKQIGNIIYYVRNQNRINKAQTKSFNRFNRKISNLFKVPVKTITYFSTRNSIEVLNFYGWDIKYNMFFSPVGGFARFGGLKKGFEYLIYSGINSEGYDHELVHLYYPHLQDSTSGGFLRLAYEGIPTYFGGSAGLNYQAHKNSLREFLKRNDSISISSQLGGFEDIQIDQHSSYVYAMGAFITELCYSKKGYEGLRFFASLNQENAIEELSKFFEIKPDELDRFIRTQLTKG